MWEKKLIILRDNREKEGFAWEFDEFDVVDTTLKTGDYTVQGFADVLCIERKGAVSEFASNVFQARFRKELERMQDFKYRYVILEFGMDAILKFPRGSTVPFWKQKKMVIRGPAILSKYVELSYKYNVPIIPCSNRESAIALARSIMKRVYNGEI